MPRSRTVAALRRSRGHDDRRPNTAPAVPHQVDPSYGYADPNWQPPPQASGGRPRSNGRPHSSRQRSQGPSPGGRRRPRSGVPPSGPSLLSNVSPAKRELISPQQATDTSTSTTAVTAVSAMTAAVARQAGGGGSSAGERLTSEDKETEFIRDQVAQRFLEEQYVYTRRECVCVCQTTLQLA